MHVHKIVHGDDFDNNDISIFTKLVMHGYNVLYIPIEILALMMYSHRLCCRNARADVLQMELTPEMHGRIPFLISNPSSEVPEFAVEK